MAQLGRFQKELQDTSGNASSGASLWIYREGASVNGNQSGVSPLAVTVRHAGKIATGDSVFVNTASGTTYSATRTSATVITLSGFGGTLALTDKDRLVPSNNQPTLYSDDQGGASKSNPLTSDSNGSVDCWMEFGAYEVLFSGGAPSLTARLVPELVTPTEYPGQIRFASSFPGADLGAQINNADTDLGTGYGEIWAPCDGQTISTAVVISTGHTLRMLSGNLTFNVTGGGKGITLKNHARLIGAGSRQTYFTLAPTCNVSAVITNDDYTGAQQDCNVSGIFVDASNATCTIGTAAYYFKKIGEPSYIEDIYCLNGIGTMPNSIRLDDCGGMAIIRPVCNVANSGTGSPISGHILINNTVNNFGNYIEAPHVENLPTNGYGVKVVNSAGNTRDVQIVNLHMEINGGNTVDAIVFDSGADGCVAICPELTYNSGTAGNVVHMLAGSTRNTVIGAYGFSGGSITSVKDDVISRTVTGFCPFYSQGATGLANNAMTSAGSVDFQRYRSKLGTTLIASDFAIVTTGKWGDTPAANVTFPAAVNPNDSRGIVNINSGTANFGANPTVVLTFKDGTFTTAPVVMVCTGSGTTDQPTIPWTVTSNATTATFTFNSTPIGSKVYQFEYWVIG